MHTAAVAHHAASHSGDAIAVVVIVIVLAVLNHMWANARQRRRARDLEN
jgi:hypothetical protein